MSASTVSITANTSTARRRPVVAGEKKTGLDVVGGEGIVASPSIGGGDKDTGGGRDLGHSIRGETVLDRSRDIVQVKKPLPNSTTANGLARRSTTRKGGVSKIEKSRWLTVVGVLIKNLLLVLAFVGFFQMIRRMVLNSTEVNVSTLPSDVDGRFAEMEAFLKTTTKMMQVQVEVVDRKIENEVGGLRRELGKKMEERGTEFRNELKKLDDRTESLQNHIGELQAKDWLAKDDFDRFFNEFKKAKGLGDGNDVNLDEVRAFARDIVEKEIERHAADGLGRVDYALASGGGTVVKHSEPYIVWKVSGSWLYKTNRNGVHSDSEKMLMPSFGEPGHCFPLKGSSGFVQIKLRTAIIPEAITLEHVAKSVAYDRSSAPKDCRISGWLQGHDATDLTVDPEKMFLLREFTYDLDKSNAQTFNVLDSAGTGIVDTVRLDFTSNHGSLSHTCIYRLRVHGHEPNSASMLSVQS